MSFYTRKEPFGMLTIFPRVMKFEWSFIWACEVGYHIRVRRILLRIRIHTLFMVLLSETCQVVIDLPPLNPVREYLKRRRAAFSRSFPPRRLFRCELFFQ